MRRFWKIVVLMIFIIGLFCVACQSEKSRNELNLASKVLNLETFAKLYGYARWFHPSDEAQEIDWDKFAILGVQKVENIKSTTALRDTLYRLFSPIVQGLQIYEARKPQTFNPEILLSPDPDAKPVAWQHLGVYLNDLSNVYRSIRTNKKEVDKRTESSKVFKRILGASHLNGKEVKFSGHFRCEKGNVKLLIRHSANRRDYERHEVLIKSHDWKKYELLLTVPKETISFIYGFEVDGPDEIWADDFELVVNNGGKWELSDTLNMGFEIGKTENKLMPIVDWRTSMLRHTIEVTDENSFSGKYSVKVIYTGKYFDGIPQFGEITKASIGNNLICVVPLTLLTNGSITYPKTELSTLARLQSELANIGESRCGFKTQVNLASIIILWNVLQHFFPYFDVIDTDWNEVLGETLKSTLANKQKTDFFVTLNQMIAQIDDGHGVVDSEPMNFLPIRAEFVENKIIITASNDSTLKIGDIICKIDGKPIMEALDEMEKLISGSPQLRRFRALNILGSKFDSHKTMNRFASQFENNNLVSKLVPGGTQLVIERDGKEQNVSVVNSRAFNPIEERKYLSETIIEIESGIYYVNMSKCTENEFEQKKDVLTNAKAVIYDQRGSSRLNFFQIIPYLIEKPVTTTWWNIPQTIYPDRKGVEFTKSNGSIDPKQPLFKSKSIIINTSDIISAQETVMGIIDHYNLATTVGESTAGCNGNFNCINLPCGYRVKWTGMKVLKHDGSQLYLKGYEPNFPVNKTIQAIRKGRDEYLEKALEVARQKN